MCRRRVHVWTETLTEPTAACSRYCCVRTAGEGIFSRVSKPVTRSILFSRCVCFVRKKVGGRGSTMTHANMSLFDAIHSQRAIRHFSTQPVSDEAVERILHSAICAPNGGN